MSTVSYEDVDPLKITKVTDPFGRFATFQYTAGKLSRITDVAGLTSDFTYATGDFVNALTTPYGTTTFAHGVVGANAWPEMTDALGGKERVEYGLSSVLDDGQSQIRQYEYNVKGMTIREIDPVGRETVNVYGANNVPDATPATGSGTDLLQTKVKNLASPGGWDVMGGSTYNAQGQPLTTTDAAGQVTTYTYDAQAASRPSPRRRAPASASSAPRRTRTIP